MKLKQKILGGCSQTVTKMPHTILWKRNNQVFAIDGTANYHNVWDYPYARIERDYFMIHAVEFEEAEVLQTQAYLKCGMNDFGAIIIKEDNWLINFIKIKWNRLARRLSIDPMLKPITDMWF